MDSEGLATFRQPDGSLELSPDSRNNLVAMTIAGGTESCPLPLRYPPPSALVLPSGAGGFAAAGEAAPGGLYVAALPGNEQRRRDEDRRVGAGRHADQQCQDEVPRRHAPEQE